MKRCLTCHMAKSVAEFPKRSANRIKGTKPARGGMGVGAHCRQCLADKRNAPGEKRCKICGETKPLSAFHTNQNCADGHTSKCADCMAVYLRQWRRKNPDAFREWSEANAEGRAEYMRDWREANKEHRSESYKAWAQANPGKVNSLIAKRSAAKKRATVAWADLEAIEAIYIEAAQLTRETGVRHEVDHIYPIQGKAVCGLHVVENLQILPKAENIRKHNRMPEELRELS